MFHYESTEIHSDPKEEIKTTVSVRNGKGTKIYTRKNKKTGKEATHKNALKKNEINAIKSRKFMPRLFHSAKRRVSRRLNRTY